MTINELKINDNVKYNFGGDGIPERIKTGKIKKMANGKFPVLEVIDKNNDIHYVYVSEVIEKYD